MGRTKRDCPVLGCTSTNLVRLANHLDQIHHMDTQERAKWLKRSKLGLCLPLQTEESAVNSSEQTLQKTLGTLLQRQEEMGRIFNNLLRGEHETSIKAFKGKRKSNEHCIKKMQNINKAKNRTITKSEWLSF